ncbi:MAG: arginine--tRNA ligase, partial [Terriglobia bacterium]
MKNRLIEVIKKALESGRDSGELPIAELPDTVLTRPKDEQHGDFTSTVAMVLASRLKMKPLDLAALIEKKIVDTADSDFLEKVEVVPPGFMNFFLSKDSFYEPLREITRTGLDYGRSAMGAGTAVQIEFVSANPVGPLHLGHGRWAAVGDSLARLLVKAGYDVSTEFYVNDYGTQMELFGRSLEAEYLALVGRPAEPPEGAYKGAYIGDLAQVMKDQVGDEVTDLGSGGQWVQFSRKGSALVLEKMADVLKTLGVEFDRWSSETELHRSGAVLEAVKALADAGATYEKDEAVWFRSTDFGDQKDRVLIRRADAGEGGGTG